MASPTSSSGAEVPPVLPSIPLAAEPARTTEELSIGGLVRDATTHVSTLVRAEVELARSEITSEVKRGLQGSIFFLIALATLLFSLFYFFFALGELFNYLGLSRAASFAIVFGLMLLTAGVFALLGYLRVRKIGPPERTISTLKESADVLTHRGGRDGSNGTSPQGLGVRTGATTR